MIEPMEVPTHSNINSGESDSDNDKSETIDDLLAVTVHALAGYSNPQTMRASGYIKRQPVTVLIDTGSTNNFLDEDVAKRLSLSVETCDKFEVKLADGRTLTCESKCSRVKLLMQNQELRADFYLLPLGDYEVVLGIEWLQTLGDVLWNFSKLIMKFMINGQNVTFRGK
jgi:predicted aspartyl protease